MKKRGFCDSLFDLNGDGNVEPYEEYMVYEILDEEEREGKDNLDDDFEDEWF
jgi:hypothetical protein